MRRATCAAALTAAAALLVSPLGSPAGAAPTPAAATAVVQAAASAPAAAPARRERDRHRFPATIPLPAGFQPEGIDSGRGTSFFVGSLRDGAVWRGDFRTGRGRVLVPGRAGAVAVGLDHERARNRLWVAGGPTGTITAYDARTGARLAVYSLPGGFLNDVVVTRRAVYVTDSVRQRLAVVPLGRGGRLPRASAVRALPLTGDLRYGEGFNANGIVAARGGRVLIVVQSSTGKLFTVAARTGRTREIDLRGESVPNGDGLELRGRTLYVVQNRLNRIAVLKLGERLRRARVLTRITDPRLDVPTTVTRRAGFLWAVNARFGTTPTPSTTYAVIRLPRR